MSQSVKEVKTVLKTSDYQIAIEYERNKIIKTAHSKADDRPSLLTLLSFFFVDHKNEFHQHNVGIHTA